MCNRIYKEGSHSYKPETSLDFGKEIGTFLQGYIEYFVNLQHQNAGYKNTDQIKFLFPFGSDNKINKNVPIYIMLTYVYKAVPFHNYLLFSRFARKFVSK